MSLLIMRGTVASLGIALGVVRKEVAFTVEPQWLDHLWDHANKFETREVQANEG